MRKDICGKEVQPGLYLKGTNDLYCIFLRKGNFMIQTYGCEPWFLEDFDTSLLERTDPSESVKRLEGIIKWIQEHFPETS